MDKKSTLKEREFLINLFKKKKYEKVLDLGKKYFKLNSNDFDVVQLIGLSAIYLKKFETAEFYFRNLILIKEDANLFYNYGKILKELGKYDEAIKNFLNSIKLKPNFSEAYNNIANIYVALESNSEAEHYYKKALQTNENNLEAYFNLANLYKDNKNFDEAKNLYLIIINKNPSNYQATHNLGTINSILGDFDEAKKNFETALELNIFNFESYKNYFEITKCNTGNHIYNKLKNINPNGLDENNKIIFYYVLGKCYFDLDKIDLAFKNIEIAKKIKKKNQIYSVNEEKILFSKIKKIFDNYKTKIKFKPIKSIPIFIVGMPRSGTTLIEQILSSHSKIFGAGELDFLPKIMSKQNLSKSMDIDKILPEIRNEYYKQIKKLSSKKYVIDKLPMNFKWIGFIAAAFPEAKILHIKRNPMAVCWSNYKTNFNNPGIKYNLDQKDVSNFYNIYFNIMNFWNEKCKNRIFNIIYEDFISDYKSNTNIVLNHLGLKFENSIIEYHKNKRPITTASLSQVRQKVYKNSSDQWKKYKAHLDIMIKKLKANGIEF